MGPAASAVPATPWRRKAKITLFDFLAMLVAGVSSDAFSNALNVHLNRANDNTRMYWPDSTAWMRLAMPDVSLRIFIKLSFTLTGYSVLAFFVAN
jgi:hypothetical protein